MKENTKGLRNPFFASNFSLGCLLNVCGICKRKILNVRLFHAQREANLISFLAVSETNMQFPLYYPSNPIIKVAHFAVQPK